MPTRNFLSHFCTYTCPPALLRCLHSLGKSNTIVAKVKFSVVWANEHISQNPQGTSGNINTQETAEALSLTQNCHLRRKTRSVNLNYYSLKIFPRFWLAKSTRIIHHNQLLITKFGRILCLTRKWRQKCSLLLVNAPLTEKTWGRGWVVFVAKTKMADTPLVSRARTTAGTRRNNG